MIYWILKISTETEEIWGEGNLSQKGELLSTIKRCGGGRRAITLRLHRYHLQHFFPLTLTSNPTWYLGELLCNDLFSLGKDIMPPK